MRPHLGLQPRHSPCAEPVTHRLADAEGTQAPVCDGHAIAAREEVVGGRIEPL
ncbi:hypothetical protein ACFSKW_38265 [Nonomuraea mangrovi]|uniref:Uncharacterized protein n=1 Tax=Nonomuraea mangrovi TaxID=2316207 RepID=A0ABW4T958_9ACTN